MVASEQTFALAQQHNQAARLAEGEALYRELLRSGAAALAGIVAN